MATVKTVYVLRLTLGSMPLWLSLLSARTASESKAVTAQLTAKWPETPLLLEASEFMAEESNEKFWQFLETVQELTIYKQGEVDHSYYNLILKKAGQFLDNMHINFLKFALSIRAYSPTIQMFQKVAADELPPDGCNAFVVIHKERTCKINGIKKLLKKATSRARPYLFKEDHKFPTNKENLPVVILYAEIGTRQFGKFHKVLSDKARNEEIIYVLRHYIQKPSSRKMFLSGYGVELAVKSTEYKVVDDTQIKTVSISVGEDGNEAGEVQGFLFGKLKERYSDLKDNLTAFQKYLIGSNKEMMPLETWELQDLSHQAASQIMSTPVYDAMKLMKDISQNYPIRARSLTKIAVNQQMREEIKENQKVLQCQHEINPGDACLYINGLRIDIDRYDPFSILNMLKLEGKIMSGLQNLGIHREDISKYLKLNLDKWKHTYVLDIRHSSIMWINDLEHDDLYVTWPVSCWELLKPGIMSGTIPSIRRNFHNLVLFIDPTQKYTLAFIELARRLYYHKVPLRIGFVFILNTDDEVDGTKDAGVALWRVFNFMKKEYDVPEAFMSIVDMYEKVKYENILTVDIVKTSLQNRFPPADIWDILGIHSKYDENRKAGASFYKKTGLGPLPQALYNGEPFEYEKMFAEDFDMAIFDRMKETCIHLREAVFEGTLNDKTNVINFLMDRNSIVTRLNSFILNTEPQYLNLIPTSVTADVEDFATFFFLDSQDKSSVIAKNMHYLTQEDDIISSVTFWIIADFDKPSGRKLLFDALTHMKTSVSARLGVIYNPTSKITEENTAISRGILTAFLTQKNKYLRHFLRKLTKEKVATAIYSGEKIEAFLIKEMDKNVFVKKYNTIGVNIFRTHQLFCQNVLKLSPGEIGIVSNGKFLGPLDETWYAEDFHLLEVITLRSLEAMKINYFVKNKEINSKNMSDLIMKIDALVSSLPERTPRNEFKFRKENHSFIKKNPPENDVFFDVFAIVDPLTREAQKMAQLLIVFDKIINMKLKVFMNCRDKFSEAPLKSFYRFVLEPELMFGASNMPSPGSMAKFSDIPESPLLTLNMITPEGWLVETVHSNCDLDNIHLEDIERTVVAEYELEYLLLEGHCLDVTTKQPPRGLEFTLTTKNKPAAVDTIVMTNLGYFQLKANPGAWILKLHQGRSEDIYDIAGLEGIDSVSDVGDIIVVLNSFKSKTLEVQVQKKKSKIKEDVLADTDDKKKAMWDTIKSFIMRSHKEDNKGEDVLNIFSVASGHLYERFLRIMMLSVLHTTKTPVKFWFLKNYLSPTFKEVIPYMAEKYGFQYELVQYGWPRWLHQQTEKQRIISGYKILFLDVLFPLTVNKIIFVDADQVVRHDLKELRDIDLGGAPYGYTPFCDSRTDMDEYRFWKTGYWASHLLKRKYHISALYVVDLKKFRKIAAGDRLRARYQSLSKDPNSLSNLDQDLPNNMIHLLPIKSLPQDWLWCEAWCDDESKQRAKTIDLCNNPKTEEPKLKAAARIVPEWTEYDTEIRQLLEHIENKKNTTSK
ncbi:UDP-glucose:glycoprotein glucosyltransferase 2 [Rhynchocyon petersi]